MVPPPPSTATRSRWPAPARATARTATASGSTSAPSSKLISSGSLHRAEAWALLYSAKPPLLPVRYGTPLETVIVVTPAAVAAAATVGEALDPRPGRRSRGRSPPFPRAATTPAGFVTPWQSRVMAPSGRSSCAGRCRRSRSAWWRARTWPGGGGTHSTSLSSIRPTPV